ncbi:DUF1992 domain-containing protein [Paenibacillus sp. CC-CFT747]|nr:DUF1992 domain-containing protein [Paenibacillus sp. CC-CFT747]
MNEKGISITLKASKPEEDDPMPLWPRRTPAGDKESRKPNRPKDAEPGSGEERPMIPLPAETLEDTDVALHAERQLIQWVDEAVDDFARRGGFDNLPGKGKPLKVPEGDVLQTIMQNAKIPPPGSCCAGRSVWRWSTPSS